MPDCAKVGDIIGFREDSDVTELLIPNEYCLPQLRLKDHPRCWSLSLVGFSSQSIVNNVDRWKNTVKNNNRSKI